MNTGVDTRRNALVLFCFVATLVSAQVPLSINYQGRLSSSSGLVNGSVSLVLRFYTNETLGVSIYEDSNTVTVTDGSYSTFIGDDTTSGSFVSALSTTSNLYLETVVNGVALTPREQIVSVAYAIRADGVKDSGINSAMIKDGVVQLSDLDTNSVDSLYVNAAGDTMTGQLDVVGSTNMAAYTMKLFSGTSLVAWAKRK